MFIRLLLTVSLLFPAPQDESPIAARGAGFELRLADLDRALLDRKAMSDEGRRALDELLKPLVVADLARKAGIEATDRDVEEMFSYLDREARKADPKVGLLDVLKQKGVDVSQFTKLLRLAILQERLTSRALNIPADRKASGEEQEIWLQQEMAKRGLERPAPPWKDGVVAICGSVRIDTQQFAEFLRASLPKGYVSETAWHLLLLQAIERRLPDLSSTTIAKAVDEEFARRQRKHAEQHPEISYAQRLGVQGRNLESVRNGPSVRIAALSRLWVDRQNDEDGLRKAYTTERQYFDGLFGRSVECHMIMLRAAKFVNTLNKRKFGDAHRELNRYRENIGSLDDFKSLAVKFSDHVETRKRQGELGFVSSGNPNVPYEWREAIFSYVDTHELTTGVMIPNVQNGEGVVLLWLESVRPAPPWEVMQERVHNELRKRFINSILPQTSVEMLPLKAN